MLNTIKQTVKGIEIVAKSGTKIKDLCKQKTDKPTNQNSAVYSIPCDTCKKVYIGETYRGMDKRVKEHKADIRHVRSTTGLAKHIFEYSHDVDWNGVKILKSGLEKKKRKAMESAYIAIYENININTGTMKISQYAAKSILK